MRDMTRRRRALMMVPKKSRLPKEYQEVEYLGSTGAQRIDTGVNGDCSFKITALSPSVTSIQIILGSGIEGGNYFGKTSVWTLGGGINFSTPATEWTDINVSFADRSRSVLATVRGEVKSRHTTYVSDQNFYLFSAPNGWYGANVRIQKCICNQNNSLVLNFVPCYRKSDNKPGMYDLVSKAFFTNQGSGEFIVGPDKS